MSRSPQNPAQPDTSRFTRELEAARRGDREAVGRVLDACRPYLLLIANEELDSDLRQKAGASDLVQETLMEAAASLGGFQGASTRQLLAWLRRILLNNLVNFSRRYRRTQRRRMDRELSLEADSRLGELLEADTTSPCAKVIRREEVQALQAGFAKLPAHYREALVMRHRDNLPFQEIGKRTQRSADAARMLWWRAVEKLAEQLDSQP